MHKAKQMYYCRNVKFKIQFSHSYITYSSTFLHCITPQALYVRFLLTETMKTSKPPNDIR